MHMENKKRRIYWLSVIIFSGALTGWSISNALSLSLADASGWWQTGIAFAGLPLIFYGLLDIEKHLKESLWKPEISIGLFTVGPISEIKQQKELSKFVSIKQGYPFFQLVIRNGGKLAAKFVKIHLEFDSFQDDGFQEAAKTTVERLAAPVLKTPQDNPFKWQNNRDFIFTGGDDWVIYPKDDCAFGFYLETTVTGQPPVPHDYHFICTVWAEGLENPVTERLTVKVIKTKSV